MQTHYKLDKIFGPVGTIAGITIFIAGIIITFYSFVGIILIVFGAFVGFTGTGTSVDYKNRRVKQYTNLFGVYRIGKWICVDECSSVEIKKQNITWRTYSRSNRTIDISDEGFYIVIHIGESSIPTIKVPTIDIAKKEAENLRRNFDIE